MNNYQFVADSVISYQKGKSCFKCLDYGCGAGQIVSILKSAGVDAYGCDVFYAGGDYTSKVAPELFGKTVLPMHDGRIPFADETFDYITSNQVFEHVEDLDAVLAEIRRVLKPNGRLLSLFPDAAVWREGHCGIPLLHWFRKRTRLRVYYALSLRSLGFGTHKQDKSNMQWAMDFCDWLDQWTFYRSYEEIKATYEKYFSQLGHIEAEWFQKRCPRLAFLPTTIQNMIVLKWGHMVFTCEKK
jgi:SAM-dependent methyltransferase